jgi:dipeptidyl aminopeptidase/acylaminoacyl peptidase
MQRAAVYLALAVLAVGVLAALYLAAKSYREERDDFVRHGPTAISRHPERTGIANLREISFAPPGGPNLAAWYAPPTQGRAAIILVHGTGADRSSLLFETRVLAEAGFGVLALDLPGQGASGGTTEWGVPERRAISAAVDWLSQQSEVDPKRIGAFGLSMGAYVLTQAAVLDPRIHAVTLAASPNDVVEQNWLATSRWGWLTQLPCYWALRMGGTPLDMRPKDIVGKIAPRPLLILNGDEDALVPAWMARQLYAAAHEPKELYIVHGAHHADYARVAPLEYAARLVEFYRRTLLNESPVS